MLGLYLASVNHVNAEIKNLGAANPLIKSSRESRLQHFLDSLVSMPRDLLDATQTMDEIATETPAFSKKQRDTMAEAVSTYMQGNDEASGKKDTKMQDLKNLAAFLTATLWAVLFDPLLSWDHKTEEFVKHCIEVLGLRNPNDGTVKNILGILEICCKKELSPEENLMEVRRIRAKFAGQRELFPGEQSMGKFPHNVNDFLKRFPYGKSFSQCDPPVASKVSDRQLRQIIRKDKMPTRDTNKAIKNYEIKSKGSNNTFSGMADQTQMQATMAALQFVLGKQSRESFREEQVRNFHRSYSNLDNYQPQLALEDRPKDSSSRQNIPPGHASTTRDVDIDSITEMAKQTLQNKKDRTKKRFEAEVQETEGC